MEQAKWLASLAHNVVIKIPGKMNSARPVSGSSASSRNPGIKVNATAILSFGQLMFAAKAGATYVSLFAGRISDEGGNAAEVIANSVHGWTTGISRASLIVGSIRSAAMSSARRWPARTSLPCRRNIWIKSPT